MSRKNTVNRMIIFIIACAIGWCMRTTLPVQAAPRVQQPSNGDHFVIVIDPGHGGENEGTIENGFLEKSMTMLTAQAMYEELCHYDDLEVYLTRTTDVYLPLKERAEYAAGVKADFLFSIHYNASVDHDLFGSEVWISSFPPYNAYGYQFGYTQMLTMRQMGLYLRGIKTKLNDRGTDYYGIIRESTELGLPAVIIEHCHVDEERDYPFCDSEEELVAFGKADALSVAKYLGLSSQELGVDYSSYAEELPEVNKGARVPSTIKDETEPEVCELELLDTDYDNGILKLKLSAADYDSPLIYYQSSYDGGQTFGPLQPWPDCDVLENTYTDTFTFFMEIPSGVQPMVMVRVYNLFDVFTDSNFIDIPYSFKYGEELQPQKTVEEKAGEPAEEAKSNLPGTTTFMPQSPEQPVKEEGVRFSNFIKLCLIIAAILLVTVMLSQMIYYNRRRRKRRQRRKAEGASKNHPR
ncbi:MAG: N-acetylmuramoyl-L-alanine amidase [Lachnospiraceae bacterium]|nr:N-acetylmuramoyl-L-alanine amidase [Lachnospiraceae bacterium]